VAKTVIFKASKLALMYASIEISGQSFYI